MSQREAKLALSRVDEAREDLAARTAEVTSDGFGDRLLAFDPQGAPSWEWLRLRSDFSAVPGIGAALVRRTELLAGLEHPALPSVRVVEDIAERGSILVRTAYTPGRRLSELARARSATFAMTVIRDLLHPLAAMQRRGESVSHGSLNLDRVLVATDGRVVIRDHVLGAALDRLVLPPSQLWSELGILQPARRRITPRQLDVLHVAAIGLATILGRAIGPEDYPDRVEALIEQHVLFLPLRQWLMAAFDLTGQGLGSAEAAHEAMTALFPTSLPGEAEIRDSLAVFGRKGTELRSSATVPLGFKHLLTDQSGTVFVLARSEPAATRIVDERLRVAPAPRSRTLD